MIESALAELRTGAPATLLPGVLLKTGLADTPAVAHSRRGPDRPTDAVVPSTVADRRCELLRVRIVGNPVRVIGAILCWIYVLPEGPGLPREGRPI